MDEKFNSSVLTRRSNFQLRPPSLERTYFMSSQKPTLEVLEARYDQVLTDLDVLLSKIDVTIQSNKPAATIGGNQNILLPLSDFLPITDLNISVGFGS